MAGTKDDRSTGEGGDPADVGFVADVLKDMKALPLHPLLVHPTAAMATATIIGMGLATQMASAWLGSLQGAMEASNSLADRLDKEANAEAAGVSEPAAPVETPAKAQALRPVKPAAPKAEKTAASKVSAKGDAKPQAASPKLVKPTVEKAVKSSKAPSAKVAVAKNATSAKRSGKTGDLKVIGGIGPKLEQMLNGKGIRSVADLAALTEAEVSSLDAELGLDGRALRDDWLGQSKALGGKRK